MRSYIKIPIKIITPKLAQNKQDSIFYAGKNIAEIKVWNRTYVLTTSGHYSFSLAEGSPNISFDSDTRMIGAGAPGGPRARALHSLTDYKISELGDKDLISNWGWFGINVWEKPINIQAYPAYPGKDQCLAHPTVVYSDYDEALEGFIDFVEKDLSK